MSDHVPMAIWIFLAFIVVVTVLGFWAVGLSSKDGAEAGPAYERCFNCGALPSAQGSGHGRGYRIEYVCSNRGCPYHHRSAGAFRFGDEARRDWNRLQRMFRKAEDTAHD